MPFAVNEWRCDTIEALVSAIASNVERLRASRLETTCRSEILTVLLFELSFAFRFRGARGKTPKFPNPACGGTPSRGKRKFRWEKGTSQRRRRFSSPLFLHLSLNETLQSRHPSIQHCDTHCLHSAILQDVSIDIHHALCRLFRAKMFVDPPFGILAHLPGKITIAN